MNKYYFSFSLRIFEDAELSHIQKKLELKNAEIKSFKNCLFSKKFTLIYFQTNGINNVFSDEEFAKFVKEFEAKKDILKDIQNHYNAEMNFCIVFERLDKKPCLSLNTKKNFKQTKSKL